MKHKLPFTPTELYDRCLFASLVHAVANIRMPFMSYAVSWHGSNFSYQYGSAWGTVSFCLAESYLVGAAREDLSERTRWYPKFSAKELLAEAPESSKVLAEKEAFQYLLDNVYLAEATPTKDDFFTRLFKPNKPRPSVTMTVATTAFWSEGDEIFSSDSIDEFNKHGGEFISAITLPIDELHAYYAEEYEFATEEFELANQLYDMKKRGDTIVHLGTVSLLKNAKSISVNHEIIDGKQEFIISLKEIGFEVVE